MIIHSTEILEGISQKKELIEVAIPSKVILLLKNVSESIDTLNNEAAAIPLLREQSLLVERNIHTAIINEKTNNQPLFDLSSLGYTNVKTESIKYLYTPKNEFVENYNVDILTTYFDYADETNDYQVLLPLYLIHVEEQLYLLPMQGQNTIIQASLEKK